MAVTFELSFGGYYFYLIQNQSNRHILIRQTSKFKVYAHLRAFDWLMNKHIYNLI